MNRSMPSRSSSITRSASASRSASVGIGGASSCRPKPLKRSPSRCCGRKPFAVLAADLAARRDPQHGFLELDVLARNRLHDVAFTVLAVPLALEDQFQVL